MSIPKLTRRKFFFLALALTSCRPNITIEAPAVPTIALTNAALIDGTGTERIPEAVVLIQAGKITVAGAKGKVAVPPGAELIDLGGGTILPGFINAHVHDGFDPDNLKAWAKAGVTTIRDEGARTGSQERYQALLDQRNKALDKPEHARIVSAGMMMAIRGGYGQLIVDDTAEAAVRAAQAELDAGADLIKVSREDGYAGMSGLPKMSDGAIRALVDMAHKRGTMVSGHITQAKFLEELVALGVNDIAHTPYDRLSDAAIARMVAQGISMNTTFSVLKSYNAIGASVDNLSRFIRAGGRVVLGNDHNGGPNRDAFELGMPMFEIEKMAEAGMSPMQIIQAGTKTAAEVCNKAKEIGTVEPGKSADLLVVDGDPVKDIRMLAKVKVVIHKGIRI